MPPRRLLPLLLVAALLAACSTQQPRLPADSSWSRHSTRLADMQSWTLEGKLALRTDARSDSASLSWLQQGDSTRLRLSGPMGLNATTIDSDGNLLTVRQGDETRHWDLADAAVLARETGWELPLKALPYWLKGLPAPFLDVQLLELDSDGTLLRGLRQDDWDIRYERYDSFGDAGDRLALPIRLSLQREATRVRLIIRDWLLPAAP